MEAFIPPVRNTTIQRIARRKTNNTVLSMEVMVLRMTNMEVEVRLAADLLVL